jgi:hypothetical protein
MNRKPQSAVGFDYGCLPIAMALAQNDFVRELRAAQIPGVAYSHTWSSDLAADVPIVALTGNNEDYLTRAFKRFNDWADATDGDSVQVTFVVRASGAYVVIIAPEPSRLARRCFRYETCIVPMAMAAQWVLEIDSAGPSMEGFRRYCEHPITPFLFTAVAIEANAGSPPRLASIPGMPRILKFDARFIDAEAEAPGSVASLWADDTSKTKVESGKALDPIEIAHQRRNTLQTNFPVTLTRMHVRSAHRPELDELQRIGFRGWQLEQAFCNIVLRDALPEDVASHDLENQRTAVLRALRGRREVATGEALPAVTNNELIQQILADGNALLRHLGRKPVKSANGLVNALKKSDMLDAGLTVGPPVWATDQP